MSNIFVKLDGIKGESKDTNHTGGWIDCLSAGFGVSQPSSMGTGGGGGVGKADFHPFTFAHFIDIASPNLFTYSASGKHIPKVEISVCKSGTEFHEYMKITLTNALVNNVMPSGSQDSLWVESVSLSYEEIKIEVKEQKKDGTLGATVPGGWNVRENKKNT